MANNDPNTPAPAKPAASVDTDVGAFADFIEKAIPVVGPAIAAFIRASARVRRMILYPLLWLAIYPVFAFVVALYIVKIMPDTPRAWVQALASEAFQIDDKITKKAGEVIEKDRTNINGSNSIIDGSSQFEFDVSKTEQGDNSYVVSAAPRQPLSFAAYVNHGSFSQDTSKCNEDKLIASLKRANMGQLLVQSVGSETKETPNIPYAEDRLKTFHRFDATIWKTFESGIGGTGGAPPSSIDFEIQFQPSDELIAAGKCSRFRVYVVMTYVKPQL